MLNVDEFPGTCPSCHRSIFPTFVAAVPTEAIRHSNVIIPFRIEAAFQCQSCRRMLIGQYVERAGNPRTAPRVFGLVATLPHEFIPPAFPDEIKSLSPRFTAIYAQARQAEQLGLDEIVGGGYRKVLEFLIKDYCIKYVRVSESEAGRLNLATCIVSYIDSDNIKDCARRAAWLGNDELHYERRWGTKDINDLKTLIQLTQAWIEHSIVTQRYRESMPEGGS